MGLNTEEPSEERVQQAVNSWSSWNFKMVLVQMAIVWYLAGQQIAVREEQEQREALADAEPPLAQPLRRLGGELTSVVFIGDLHADAGCAEQWLRQTKLVDMESEPWA